MSYIEKTPISEYSCCKESCVCGSECGCGTNPGNSESSYDISKYSYLDDFDTWEDVDKYALFMPMVKHVYCALPRDNDINECDIVNIIIAKIHMKSGRTLKEIKYDYSHNGYPTVLLIFNPITESILPEPYATKIRKWGILHYLINNSI